MLLVNDDLEDVLRGISDGLFYRVLSRHSLATTEEKLQNKTDHNNWSCTY
jgi:hypothetical protein